MFRCDVCKEVVGPHIKSLRVVAETRPVRYPVREAVNRVSKKGRLKWVDDAGGEGDETVRELVLCPRCAVTSSSSSPRQ